MFSRFLAVATLLALVSACTVTQTPIIVIEESKPDPLVLSNWEAAQQNVKKITNWRIRGKLAVKAGKKGGHASLRWNKNEQTEHLELFGPLGGGRVEIDINESGAILKDTRGRTLTGPEMEPLLQQRLGWPLPFNKLSSWIKGGPAAQTSALKFDESGQLSSMNDGGWQVNFPEYQTVKTTKAPQMEVLVPRVIELNALPGTLTVYDDKGDYVGEELFIRLIINSWR